MYITYISRAKRRIIPYVVVRHAGMMHIDLHAYLVVCLFVCYIVCLVVCLCLCFCLSENTRGIVERSVGFCIRSDFRARAVMLQKLLDLELRGKQGR